MQSARILLANGALYSVGLLLVAAGASKAYAVVRGADVDSVIRRALRIPTASWRIALVAVSLAEILTGAAIWANAVPSVVASALVVQGLAFTGIVFYTLRRGMRGDCGCLQARYLESAITWRTLARAAIVIGAGVLAVAVPRSAATALERPWAQLGFVCGAGVLVGLSINIRGRAAFCGSRLRSGRRVALAELRAHPLFAAMSESAGPLSAAFVHRSADCAHEFTFPVDRAGGAPRRAVTFRVTRGPARRLVVQAVVEAIEAPQRVTA